MVSACTDMGVQMNMNTAHCLLGYRDNDSIRKTAKEMGWMLTRGVLKTCEHCMMSKAKQNNVKKESVAKNASIPIHHL